MKLPHDDTQALREMLLLLLASEEPASAALLQFIYSLSPEQLVEQIEITQTVMVATLARLREQGDLPRLH